MLIEFQVHGKNEGEITDAALKQTAEFFDRSPLWELDFYIIECRPAESVKTWEGNDRILHWEASVLAGLKEELMKEQHG